MARVNKTQADIQAIQRYKPVPAFLEEGRYDAKHKEFEPPCLTDRPTNRFEQRLAESGAMSGVLQCSLLWNNTDDLDLYCDTPSGDEIYYGNRKAAGGHLDVDANADNTTHTPGKIINVIYT